MGAERTGVTRRSGAGKPSQALRLPAAAWAPPAPAPPPPGTGAPRPGRTRLVVVSVVVLISGVVAVTTLAGGRATPSAGPDLDGQAAIDIATEDAVIGLLQLFAAEVRLTDAAATDGGAFALPGPAGRAQAVLAEVEAVSAVLTATRAAGWAPGTPGMTYAQDPDHDALLAAAMDVAEVATDLAYLNDVHLTLLTGTGTAALGDAPARLGAVAQRYASQPAIGQWATALTQVLVTPGAGAAAVQARQSADAAFIERADAIAPAALDDLTAFLNGIDPAVLAALDGHPVAGPALRLLRG